ncbi:MULTISPECIES: DHA2 family efflux MFS transporter permease subunit [unclassified Pseudomonas]|jgi:EmrB/QacA subfamily drug resistance transporter|uniref:DHA2 family efflux MFS transporter permease subunit n=1 Tax=unclassified Pseudomonas TaxID=196821 RepID=UPI000C869FED|nr:MULTISPECIES: DHA2 family efflux MFS transporter permease subunit [unclassified Pseudomonas]NWA33106.1 DHA2 family efflux MFS transporter permease subunit [Pseudomonas sp. C6002]NWB10430.1 DHA2 family efflux MFS transporter permease subunit [Pseudomonas sp. D5002]NWB44062.1 DHA2 family efflux MFS transporter permease subunit [Pseudomonas sp. E6002]NWB61428.1 DHA2 family efflux MFS transporter permease subunit [Pseudomonas sp. F1002]NWC02020.1 DHA2 family efflux MFS transporter permease subu
MTSTSQRRSTLIALLVAVTFFMENLDATVIATALPDIAKTFGVGAVDVNIGMSAYMLAVAVFIPISGWLADRFGSRRVFGWAIVLFSLSSLLCGWSDSLQTFVAARVLQGISGAMMVPVGRLAVLRATEKKDLVRAISFITWPGLVAPILGPPVGGFIVTHASWPWIFYLNLPLGLLALIATLVLIPKHDEVTSRSFDFSGFLLVGVASAALLYGVELLGQSRGSLLQGLLLSAAGVMLGAFAWRHMRRHAQPLLALGVVSVRTFSVCLCGGSIFRVAISTLPFLLPLMFQLAFGLSAFDAGLLVLAVFAGNLAMKPFTTAVMQRWGFRSVLMINGILGVLAIAACALLDERMSWALILFILFVGGLSRSMQFTLFNTLGFADIPKAQMSDASTLFSMFFQLSMAMGVAIGALLLRFAMNFHGNTGQAATADFQLTFLLVAVIAGVALLDNLRLPPQAGESVLQRK